jgi:hypothetical protein
MSLCAMRRIHLLVGRGGRIGIQVRLSPIFGCHMHSLHAHQSIDTTFIQRLEINVPGYLFSHHVPPTDEFFS